MTLPAGKLEFRGLYFFDLDMFDFERCLEPIFAPNFAARTTPPNCDLALTCLRLFSWLASSDMYAYGMGFPGRITSPRPRCKIGFKKLRITIICIQPLICSRLRMNWSCLQAWRQCRRQCCPLLLLPHRPPIPVVCECPDHDECPSRQ